MMADEDSGLRRVGLYRLANARAAAEYAKQGGPFVDIAIASIYSSADIAARLHGSYHDGIEWLRGALGILERSVLEQDRIDASDGH